LPVLAQGDLLFTSAGQPVVLLGHDECSFGLK
jgi:hypothetical protein